MTKLRILIIHNTYFEKGGEDSAVQQDIALLQKIGHEVYTCFFSNEAFRKPGWKAPLLAANLFFNLGAYTRVYRMVKKYRIDFVHVHNFFYTASTSVFRAAKSAGAATIFTVHNYRLFCLNGFFFRNEATCMLCHEQNSFQAGILHRCFKSSKLFSFLLGASLNANRAWGIWHKQVDRFIVLNPLTATLLAQAAIPDEKIFFRNNFLNQTLELGPAAYGSRQDYYLFAGRISEEKGIRPLVEIFRSNKKPLRIVGNGPLADWVKQQAGNNITYHEAIPREELFAWYASCKALVFPSLWPEGQPMVILEAQSTGAPIIAARSAITERMVGHQRGLLYDMGNSRYLAEAVTVFEQLTPEQRQHMSEAASRYFNEEHTEAQQVQVLKEIYTLPSAQ